MKAPGVGASNCGLLFVPDRLAPPTAGIGSLLSPKFSAIPVRISWLIFGELDEIGESF
jgi:hypothetical protein